MPGTLTMTDKQHASAGVTILDQDGKPFAALPDGVSVAFVSDNPAVAGFTTGPDGMNGDISSGEPGTSTIIATVTMPDGSVLSDSVLVFVTNSAPGSVNFTVGTPVDE